MQGSGTFRSWIILDMCIAYFMCITCQRKHGANLAYGFTIGSSVRRPCHPRSATCQPRGCVRLALRVFAIATVTTVTRSPSARTATTGALSLSQSPPGRCQDFTTPALLKPPADYVECIARQPFGGFIPVIALQQVLLDVIGHLLHLVQLLVLSLKRDSTSAAGLTGSCA